MKAVEILSGVGPIVGGGNSRRCCTRHGVTRCSGYESHGVGHMKSLRICSRGQFIATGLLIECGTTMKSSLCVVNGVEFPTLMLAGIDLHMGT